MDQKQLSTDSLNNLLNSLDSIRRMFRIVDAVCVGDIPDWMPVTTVLQERYGWNALHIGGSSTSTLDQAWKDDAASIQKIADSLYPLASIVIITFNNIDYTRLCLQSIYNVTSYPAFEVIVVDNASEDGTPEFLKAFAADHPNCRILLNPTNEGFARGNNQGIREARGEYIVLLNNDTVVTRPWLSRLLLHLSRPEVGLVGPVTNFSGNESRIQVPYHRLEDMEPFAEQYTEQHLGQTFGIPVLALFCTAMRRSLIEDVGLLDERFGIGMFEDDDYSFRVRRKGYSVICAEDVFIHHWGRAAFSKLETAAYTKLFNENRRKYEEKWNTAWQPHRARN